MPKTPEPLGFERIHNGGLEKPAATRDAAYHLVATTDTKGSHLKSWARDCNEVFASNNEALQNQVKEKRSLKTSR